MSNGAPPPSPPRSPDRTRRSKRRDEEVRALVDLVREGLVSNTKVTRLLECIAWPAEVEKDFFDRGASALPRVTYEVDREGSNARIVALTELLKKLPDADDDPVVQWLRGTVQSFVDGNRMLLAVGTREFYEISRGVYGGAQTAFLDSKLSNLDLAEHLLDRLRVRGGDEASDAPAQTLSDEEFAEEMRRRLGARAPKLEVEVAVDPSCAAKAVAGMTRVRVRKGARFLPWEAESLWRHEIETHALTAQNGAAQEVAPFLKAGGPRVTGTQEGLAIFAELYDGGLSVDRIARLARRVALVDMAERGGSFLDLYRYLIEQGSEPHDAYLDAQRVCRGGLVSGGAPFTKDACYVAGLLNVYTYLSVVVRGGLRDEAEMLVAGRVALEDMPALAELRNRGILSRPKYLPRWLARWRELLPYFAFTSFFNAVDLARVEKHYREVLEIAERLPPKSS